MRNYVLKAGVFALAIGHYAQGLQLATEAFRDDSDKLVAHSLDEHEVEQRGSHCLDGSAPLYHHKVGKERQKWVFFLDHDHCTSLQECASQSHVAKNSQPVASSPLQTHTEFEDYNHVFVDNCDLGLYLGNADEPVDYGGKKLYFQGSRVIKHVIDVLNAEYGMTDVLIMGGSGGGRSAMVGADYFQSIMPKSVTRFGVAPINGYGQGKGEADVKSGYSLHNMADNVPAGCQQAHEDPYVCIKPREAYEYTKTNLFLVQVFDHTTFMWDRPSIMNMWENCLHHERPSGPCTDEEAQTLSSFWQEFVANVTKLPNFKRVGQGGFLPTCNTHNFYKVSSLVAAYTIDGVNVGDAIASWWRGLKSPESPPQWHLPCTLGKTAEEVQCGSCR